MPINISISDPIVVYTQSQTNQIISPNAHQAYYDGTINRVPQGGGSYLFMSPVGDGNDNGHTGINYRWVGSDSTQPAGNPADSTGRSVSIVVSGAPSGTYNYIGLGKILVNPNDNSLFAGVHCERWPNGNIGFFYGSIGIARSVDNGLTWSWCGEIIQPNIAYTTSNPTVHEIGGAPLIVVGNWIYLYYKETLLNGSIGVGVARTEASLAYLAAISGGVSTWNKWDGSGWNQVGLGGAGSLLLGPAIEQPDSGWDTQLFFPNFFDVIYHSKSGLFLAANYGLRSYLVWSQNGINWSTTHIQLSSEISNRLVYVSLWAVYPKSSWAGSGQILMTYVWNGLSGQYEVHQRTIRINSGSSRIHANKFRGGPNSLVSR